MRRRILHRPTPGTVLGLIALAVALSGVAYAAIPSADGVIHGCYKAGASPAGQLRVIDAEAGGKCATGEKPLNWNATGPKGDTGAPGMSGYEIVTRSQDFTETEANRTKFFGTSASCPAGKKAVGGGGRGGIIDSATHFVTDTGDVVESRPFEFEGTSGWGIVIGKPDGGYLAVGEQISATAYAVCVNVAN